MRITCVAFLWLMLLGAGPPPGPASDTGIGNLAILTSVEGLLADSLAARVFVDGLRGVFMDEYFLTERIDAAAPSRFAGDALSGHFRLVQGDAFGDEWELRVRVLAWRGFAPRASSPADSANHRPSPGLRVEISVRSAAAAQAGERPVTTREDLTFLDPPESRLGRFGQAGRAVGRLAVEALHHESGDLDRGLRVRLMGAERRDIEALEPAPRPH